ncbi:MAG: lipopolysaccharide biosynthesis protein [Flavobacteriales bacterium]|nr:lipopolysaccharide biosynthesis protein [Flavobacteriales bacterium]
MNSTNRQLVSGVFYTAIAKYMGIIISLLVTAVLARQLNENDFAVVAIATVLIAFFAIFSDMGIAPAIVQNNTLTKKDLGNIFSFTIWVGVLLSAVFFLSAPLIGHFYGDDTLVSICRLLSINLFFATINVVPSALLTKERRFRFIAMRSFTVQSICGAIAVVAVFMGAGLYALLVNPILSAIILFIINFSQYPQHPRFTLGFSSVKKILSFSVYQMLFNIINYFSRNLDKLMIGKYLTMGALGFYEKSYRAMMLPLQNITFVVTPVMHPVFATMQNDIKQMVSAYEKVVRVLSLIGFPLSIFLFFSAEEIILILFGPHWVQSVSVFQILSLSVGVQIILSTSGAMFQSANRTKILFISGVLSTILNVAGLLIGLFIFKTLNAIAVCILITYAINFFQCFILLYRTTFHMPMRDFWKQMLRPIILSIIIGVILFGISFLTENMPLFVSLIIKGIITLVIWIAFVQKTNEIDIIGKIKNKIHHKKI